MTLAHQAQDVAKTCDINCDIDEELVYVDLSEIVCHLWEYWVVEPCYALVSVSNGYVERLMEAEQGMTTDEIKQAIADHRQALQNISECIATPEWWEHVGAITALEEHLIAETEGHLCPPLVEPFEMSLTWPSS